MGFAFVYLRLRRGISCLDFVCEARTTLRGKKGYLRADSHQPFFRDFCVLYSSYTVSTTTVLVEFERIASHRHDRPDLSRQAVRHR